MIKFFVYIVKIFEYLPKILAILKGLNSLLSTLKTEEKQDTKQQAPKDSGNKAESEKEKTNTSETSAKPMFDEKRLNYLENRSYFLANVGSLKEFESLSEEIKTLSPDLFKERFPKAVKEKNVKTKLETPTEEKTTKIVDEKHQQRKNELINKVTFIMNKCGLSSDFEKLPDDVRTMDPTLFKEKSKDCKF
jgi:DNA polymerase III alpha subunit